MKTMITIAVIAVLHVSSAARAQQAKLPAGWTVASTSAGMSEIHIAGSSDVVIAGILPGAAVDIATLVASQTTAAFKIEAPFPLKRDGDGNVQSGATLTFTDGRRGVKFVIAGAAQAGGTALAAIVTTDAGNQAALANKVASMGNLFRSLQAGSVLPLAANSAVPLQPRKMPSRTPTAVAVAKPIPGMAGLAGMWVRSSIENRYGMSGMELVVEKDTLVFGPDGHFIADVPSGAGFAVALATWPQQKPDRAGTASLAGNALALRYANGKTANFVVVRSGTRIIELRLGDKVYNPKYIPANGLKLSGSYIGKNLSQIGMSGADTTSFVGSSSELQFTADGRFAAAREVYADTPAVVSSARDAARQGRYEVRDGALILSYANGEKKLMSIWYEDSNLEAIWLDDVMYKK